jgi:primosomal protein N' (replication factor Y)
MGVTVPFGKGNRLINGFVIELNETSEYPEEKIKEIAGITKAGVGITADAIKLAAWMKTRYGGTMIAALKTVLPAKRAFRPKEKKSIQRLMGKEEITTLLTEAVNKKHNAKVRILRALLEEELLPYELVAVKLAVSKATLSNLEKQGVIAVETVSFYRNPVRLKQTKEAALVLRQDQKLIVDEITSDYQSGKRGTYLLHGITGSGKTEVYIHLIKEVIAKGRQCILLIPEIALTYQTLLRFYKHFGDRVSVINSSLSAGERFDQCERARRGEIDIIIGPRSALFVPFPDLGIIIIDEEHETSYKSEQTPRYHARETAAQIALMKEASLVLGSATPSLEAYHRAMSGEYRLFRMDSRPGGGCLSQVSVVDMRKELWDGNRGMFSRRLQELISAKLAAGEQVMLFLNRRGYSGFVSCRSCGHVHQCPHCDVSLAKHQGGRMLCHYCGYKTAQLLRCPQCDSQYFLGFKAGTQQVVENLEKLWPQARIIRMDGDTTKKKESYEEILSVFGSGMADILVGTQMIVKGHDFPNVTLVGILAADLSLNINDFRAGERTFQLLTQAAGRAGRGTKAGEVVIQTYRPEHYSIVHAANQDFPAFFAEEIMYRELAAYPPVSHILAIWLGSDDEEKGRQAGRELVLAATSLIEDKSLGIIGPASAAIAKINDVYRFVIYVKHHEYHRLIDVKDCLESFIEAKKKTGELSGVTIQFDFNT